MKYLFSWKVVAIYIFFIVLFSFYPFSHSAPTVCFTDKIAHFFMYGGLSFLMVNTLLRQHKRAAALLTLFSVFFLGVVIEVGQFFTPYRSFETGDIFFNFLGSLAGIISVLIRFL